MDINKKGQITGLLSPFLEKKRLSIILPYIRGNSVLDIGCGSANLSFLIPKVMKYVGVDLDHKLIESIKEENPNLELYCLDIEKSALQNESKFDSIVMAAVIEHFKDPYNVLKIIQKYISGNGRLIITTPVPLAGKILRHGSKIRIFSREAVGEHKKLFSKKELKALFAECGFKIKYYHKFLLGLNQLIVLEKIEHHFSSNNYFV